MAIIKTHKNLTKAVLFVLIAVSLGFNIYNYLQNSVLENLYNVLTCIVNQFDENNLICFIASGSIPGNDTKAIEIFDITKGEVIERVQYNPIVQKEATAYLRNITGMYGKIKVFPDKGYIIKVPLVPSVAINNQFLNGYDIYSADEVFIIFPPEGAPYLLVLDSKYRPFLYNFNVNTDKLLNILDFQPEDIIQ